MPPCREADRTQTQPVSFASAFQIVGRPMRPQVHSHRHRYLIGEKRRLRRAKPVEFTTLNPWPMIHRRPWTGQQSESIRRWRWRAARLHIAMNTCMVPRHPRTTRALLAGASGAAGRGCRADAGQGLKAWPRGAPKPRGGAASSSSRFGNACAGSAPPRDSALHEDPRLGRNSPWNPEPSAGSP
jgi:hypothetical protein